MAGKKTNVFCLFYEKSCSNLGARWRQTQKFIVLALQWQWCIDVVDCFTVAVMSWIVLQWQRNHNLSVLEYFMVDVYSGSITKDDRNHKLITISIIKYQTKCNLEKYSAISSTSVRRFYTWHNKYENQNSGKRLTFKIKTINDSWKDLLI